MQQRNGDTDLFESQTDICGGLDGSTWVAEDKAFNSERLATLRQPQQVKPRNMRQGVKKKLGLRCVRRTKTFQFKVLEWSSMVSHYILSKPTIDCITQLASRLQLAIGL